MSRIDTSKLHHACKGYQFKYAELSNLYDETPPKHCILARKGSKGSWQVAGTGDGPCFYESKKEAMADLEAIRRWQREDARCAS